MLATGHCSSRYRLQAPHDRCAKEGRPNMAQKYLVQIVDDLDGTQLDQNDAEQVSFAIDGVSYVIDLSTSNAENLRNTLRQYTDAARRADTAARATGGSTRRESGTSAKRTDLEQVRAWANANDRPVSTRGRIPATILEAYDAAH
jgi:hypothetical protein